MFKSKETTIELFRIQSGYTRGVLEQIPERSMNETVITGVRPAKDLLVHLCQAQESIVASVLDDNTRFQQIGERYSKTNLSRINTLLALLSFRDQACERFVNGLAEFDWLRLDAPFETFFNNRTTPRNYFLIALQEEIHHRSQVLTIGRALGVAPPEYPGKAIAELDVEQ